MKSPRLLHHFLRLRLQLEPDLPVALQFRAVPKSSAPRRSSSDRLAAILAHPDDESRIVGGTLALHASRGWSVALYCATRGEAGDPATPPGDVALLRELELESACRTLGVSQLHLGRLRDGRLTESDVETMIEDVVRFLRRIRPQVVVTFGPDGRDGHPDHITIGRIATAACERSGSTAFEEHRALGLHPWSPSRLYHAAMPDSARERFGWPHPTKPEEELVRVDASPVFERKRQAVVHDHASQFQLSPWRLDAEAWRAREVEHFVLAASSSAALPGDLL